MLAERHIKKSVRTTEAEKMQREADRLRYVQAVAEQDRSGDVMERGRTIGRAATSYYRKTMKLLAES